MLALTVESAKNLGLVVTVGLVVLALFAFWTITAFAKKLVTTAILAALALGVWTQRADVKECGRNLRARVEVGAPGKLSCTFFGTKIGL
ncbi:MAG: hypothetical protein V9E89_13435 [Ilumatobacteraceae bacterium]|jgi:uncharacterized membrane protein YqjE